MHVRVHTHHIKCVKKKAGAVKIKDWKEISKASRSQLWNEFHLNILGLLSTASSWCRYWRLRAKTANVWSDSRVCWAPWSEDEMPSPSLWCLLCRVHIQEEVLVIDSFPTDLTFYFVPFYWPWLSSLVYGDYNPNWVWSNILYQGKGRKALNSVTRMITAELWWCMARVARLGHLKRARQDWGCTSAVEHSTRYRYGASFTLSS